MVVVLMFGLVMNEKRQVLGGTRRGIYLDSEVPSTCWI